MLRTIAHTAARCANRATVTRSMHTMAAAAVAASTLRPTTAAAAASASVFRAGRRGLVSTSKSIDGKPLYTNEELDDEKFTFSKCIKAPKTAHIIGAPMSLGQPKGGVDQGPSAIRESGLHARLIADHWKVEDTGDVDFSQCDELGRAAAQKAAGPSAAPVSDSSIALNSLAVGHANYLVYKQAFPSAQSGKFVLTLGGDHSIAVGSIAAILKARPDSAIIWVDAHADINPPAASGSGNIHGMVLSFLMDLDNTRRSISGFEWLESEGIPKLHPSRLVYIGLRDLDWAEKQIIRNLNIKAFTMQDVDRLGMADVMRSALDHCTSTHRVPRPIHLTFDIDSVDPLYAPSTGTRVSGGLTYREAYFICEMAADTGLLGSMDLVEVNPSINAEGGDKTIDMAVGLCASAMGNKIL